MGIMSEKENQIVAYQPNETVRLDVRLENETVWLNRWANTVLKEYLLRGYSVNTRLNQLEDKMDRRLAKHDSDIVELKGKVDFFVLDRIKEVA